jgi:hypothetical protein
VHHLFSNMQEHWLDGCSGRPYCFCVTDVSEAQRREWEAEFEAAAPRPMTSEPVI